jgi:hypothetical protein
MTTHVLIAFYQSCFSHPARDAVVIGSRLSSTYTFTDVRTSITTTTLCGLDLVLWLSGNESILAIILSGSWHQLA